MFIFKGANIVTFYLLPLIIFKFLSLTNSLASV